MPMKRISVGVLLPFLFFIGAARGYAGKQSNSFDVPMSAVVGSGYTKTPEITSMWVLDDDADPSHIKQGTQTSPNPGTDKMVSVYVVVEQENNKDSCSVDATVQLETQNKSVPKKVKSVQILAEEEWHKINKALRRGRQAGVITLAQEYKLSEDLYKNKSCLYKALVPMHCYDPAGIYDILIAAGSVERDRYVTSHCKFEWVPIGAIDSDFDKINFGVIKPGANNILAGDNDMTTKSLPTIKNEGNTPLSVTLTVEPLIGKHTSTRIDMFTASVDDEMVTLIAPASVQFSQQIGIQDTKSLSLYVTAGSDAPSDEYEGQISIFASIGQIADEPSLATGGESSALEKSKSGLKPIVTNKAVARKLVDCCIEQQNISKSFIEQLMVKKESSDLSQTYGGSQVESVVEDNQTGEHEEQKVDEEVIDEKNKSAVTWYNQPNIELEGLQKIEVSVSAHNPIETVKLVVDGCEYEKFLFNESTACYMLDLDINKLDAGKHCLIAKAMDIYGNEIKSSELWIMIEHKELIPPSSVDSESTAVNSQI